MAKVNIGGAIESAPLNNNFDDSDSEISSLKGRVSNLEANKANKSDVVIPSYLLASNIVNDTNGVAGYGVDNALLGLQQQITPLKNSDGILNVSSVIGTTITNALDATDARVDNLLVAQDLDPNKDSELVDIRTSAYYGDTSTVANDRIDNIEVSKAEETMITNSFHADPQKYYGNVKTIADFQGDGSDWSTIHPVTDDTTNFLIGKSSIKLVKDTTTSLSVSASKDVSLDFTSFNNGEPFSSNDYIVFPVFIRDYTIIDYIQFFLDTIEDTDRFLTTALTVTQNGWNFIKVKKSEMNTNGTPDWSNINSLEVYFRTNSTSDTTSVNFQLLQLVKKDPIADYPNQFQRNGVRDFEILEGEWFVGEEFGKLIIRNLDSTTDILSLKSKYSQSNFIANTVLTRHSGTSSRAEYLVMWEDVSNYLRIFTSGDEVFIRSVKDGVLTDIQSEGMSGFGDGTKLNCTIARKGSEVSVTLINMSTGETTQLKADDCFTGGNFSLYQRNGIYETYDSLSITEISHASHSDLSETSKSLIAQAGSISLNTSLQSLSSGTTDQGLALDSDEEDYFFDSNSSLERTIRESGKYLITLNADYESNTTGGRDVKIKINSTQISHDSKLASSAGETGMSCSVVRKLSAGDIITLTGWQNSGVSLDIATTLEITKVF